MPTEDFNPTTSGFVLAAAITALVNTVLACAKDAYPPLKAFLKSIAGHDWTTQGLFDLALFFALGLIFASTKIGARMNPGHLIATLVGAVVIAAAGLALWFALV
jgi:hypothetical protein